MPHTPARADDRLEQTLANALRWQGEDPENWVPAREGADHDVVVIGGGQTGVAIAYGLRRRGIHRTLVIDKAPEGEAGVWTTSARMVLLRTQKTIAGPEYGNVLLGFRAWYETQHGSEAFDALTRIPRLVWAAYLDWFRKAVRVPVRHDTELADIEPLTDGLLRLHLRRKGEVSALTTRKLVLATGFAGAGEIHVPGFIRTLPGRLWAHTTETIDFDALKGKAVGIIGAGPSAFDNAAVALEAGAREVHLFSRRARIAWPSPPPPGAPPRGKYYQGAYDHFFRLPDRVRWLHQKLLDENGTSAPLDSIERAVRFDNFHIHSDARPLHIEAQGDGLAVTAKDEAFALDFLIAATGYRVDLSARPELRRIVDKIALWGDAYRPQPGEENPAGALYPYLGEGFEFTEKRPGEAPYLGDIHCYNIAASLSSGKYLSDVPSMGELPRLIAGIGRGLFFADAAHHAARINDSTQAPPDEAPYARAIWGQNQKEVSAS